MELRVLFGFRPEECDREIHHRLDAVLRRRRADDDAGAFNPPFFQQFAPCVDADCNLRYSLSAHNNLRLLAVYLSMRRLVFFAGWSHAGKAIRMH